MYSGVLYYPANRRTKKMRQDIISMVDVYITCLKDYTYAAVIILSFNSSTDSINQRIIGYISV